MTGLRRTALLTIGLLVTAAALTSFSESYRALVVWADGHGLHGAWAILFPLQLDVFIAVGELALFVALVDAWPVRSRLLAWVVTVTGLAVSTAGNVGHLATHDVASRVTAAVPPLAAAAALTVGLGVLKRVVGDRKTAPADSLSAGAPSALNGHAAAALEQFSAELASGRVPTIRRIRSQMHVGQPRAQQVREYLASQIPNP